MRFEEYQFGTPQYAQSIELRDDILRAPLGLDFTVKMLEVEWQDIHIGAFDDSGEICACLVLSPMTDDAIKMRQVAVKKSLQGQGIGSDLVHFTEALLRLKGYTKIELNARLTAVKFYQRLDYDIVGDEFFEVGIAHFRMEKNI